MDALDIASNRNQIIKDEVDLMASCYKGENLDVILALGDKIMHMCINIGSPSSVKPMIKSIVNGNVKMWSTVLNTFGKNSGTQIHGLNTGRIHRTWKKEEYVQGHFRWNFQAYMLTREDRDFLNDFFFNSKRNKGANIGGIVARTIHSYKISDNTTRMVIDDPKGNEYAIYYYADTDTMFGNWKREHFVGDEKTKILKLMEKEVGKLNNF